MGKEHKWEGVQVSEELQVCWVLGMRWAEMGVTAGNEAAEGGWSLGFGFHPECNETSLESSNRDGL